jgi:hypothetical protein
MKKETISSLTIAIALTALLIFSSHQQAAQAAPSVKKIRVTDGGSGVWSCSASQLTEDGVTTTSGSAGVLQIGVTADKITGKLSGTWQIVFKFSPEVIASGVISGGKIKANSFSLLGTETSLNSFFSGCGPTPIPVTFTGQCGTDVAISFKAEKQQPDLVQTQSAIFRDVSVSCTK